MGKPTKKKFIDKLVSGTKFVTEKLTGLAFGAAGAALKGAANTATGGVASGLIDKVVDKGTNFVRDKVQGSLNSAVDFGGNLFGGTKKVENQQQRPSKEVQQEAQPETAASKEALDIGSDKMLGAPAGFGKGGRRPNANVPAKASTFYQPGKAGMSQSFAPVASEMKVGHPASQLDASQMLKPYATEPLKQEAKPHPASLMTAGQMTRPNPMFSSSAPRRQHATAPMRVGKAPQRRRGRINK